VNAIELFSCSGGMAEGFRRAGIHFDLVVDKDPDACDSYTSNIGHRPVQMDARDLFRLVRIGWRPPRQLDLLVADPPCTPWSRAGKRLGIADGRDMLVETCELIGLLRPRTYLIGNVPGLNDAPTWHIVQEHVGGLRVHGYCVADYAELDAAAYGVPQHRIRPFWFGHLAGPCVRWPEPTHGPAGAPAFPGMELRPFVTCRQALEHLSADELGRRVRVRMRTPTGASHSEGARSGAVRMIPAAIGTTRDTPNSRELLLFAKDPSSQVDSPALTVGARDRGQNGTLLRTHNPNLPATAPDEVHRTITTAGGGHTHLLQWPWDRPATTIQADERLAPPGHKDENWHTNDGGRARSTPNAVVLSERAAAILQGFPPGWVFAGKTKRARWSQLGQAMPPPLAEAVARKIVEQLCRAAQEAAA
jgi:DNA (cytosine-5)-methyltransferase 1